MMLNIELHVGILRSIAYFFHINKAKVRTKTILREGIELNAVMRVTPSGFR